MAFNPHEAKFLEEIESNRMLNVKRSVEHLLSNLDEGVQMRVSINPEIVNEYRDLWLAGVEFPPLDVFYDEAGDKRERTADGIHRLLGARAAAIKMVTCKIYRGTRRDAILFACQANNKHGARPSKADKRKAALTLILDNEWGKKSNVWIAEMACCSEFLIRSIREELIRDANQGGEFSPRFIEVKSEQPETRSYIDKHGQAGEMKLPTERKKLTYRNPEEASNDQAQSTEATAPSTHAEREDTTSTEEGHEASQPTEVECAGCRGVFFDEDTIQANGRIYCGDCTQQACDCCEERIDVQSLQLFDGDLLYCSECAVVAARLRAPQAAPDAAPALSSKPLVGEPKEEKGAPTIQPSGSEHWCTPPDHIEVIEEFAGGQVALDPCSNSHALINPMLRFVKEDSGLERDWWKEMEERRLHGLVYVNPPYDQETCEKTSFQILAQHRKGCEVLALMPCKLDQEWWQSTVFETVSAICFVKNRIKFWEEGKPKGGAPGACAYLYWGPDVEAFAEVFAKLGKVIEMATLREAEAEKYERAA